MPRLRDTTTGSIVNVSEETAARLPSTYVPADQTPEPEEKSTPRTRRARPRKSAE